MYVTIRRSIESFRRGRAGWARDEDQEREPEGQATGGEATRSAGHSSIDRHRTGILNRYVSSGAPGRRPGFGRLVDAQLAVDRGALAGWRGRPGPGDCRG